MHVEAIACLKDNYAYLLTAPGRSEAVVVDPSETAPVLAALARRGLSLAAVLCTHHHPDHVGGVVGLSSHFAKLRVYAHQTDGAHIDGLTDAVGDGDEVSAAGVSVRALHVPGHTLGAVAWHGEGEAFTGDTLFLAGCGRLFEGTAAQMARSLHAVLGSLDPSTRLWCGHEYTKRNLGFASSLSADDPEVALGLSEAEEAALAGRPTVPGTVARELAVNPFLRCADPAFRRSLSLPDDAVEAFAELRARRDRW